MFAGFYTQKVGCNWTDCGVEMNEEILGLSTAAAAAAVETGVKCMSQGVHAVVAHHLVIAR